MKVEQKWRPFCFVGFQMVGATNGSELSKFKPLENQILKPWDFDELLV